MINGEGMARPGHTQRQTPESFLVGLQLRGAIIWIRSLHPNQ
jgi:hypothetical protein